MGISSLLMADLLKKKTYLCFLISLFCFGTATALFRGVLDTYLATILEVSKSSRGVVEFFRELPGLFLFVILALFYTLNEQRILRIGYLIALVGLLSFAFIGSGLVTAIIFLMIWSAGQHIVMPVRQSYAVHSVPAGQEGKALGLMRSVQSGGQVVGFFVVPLIFLLFSGVTGFHATFLLVALLILAAIAATYGLASDSGKIRRQRLYFNRKYMTYYLLQNFYGARKQVFLTFGPYVLIVVYGASASLIATLMGVCAVLNIFVSPLIGKIIDKAGYKAVMVGDTVILFFVALVYGFSHRLFGHDVAFYVICSVFIIDSVVSNASMAASVYVRALSDDKEEMTATLTTGISIDHLVSIFIALIGGFIWEYLGIELLFTLAALLAVANSLLALRIKSPVKS